MGSVCYVCKFVCLSANEFVPYAMSSISKQHLFAGSNLHNFSTQLSSGGSSAARGSDAAHLLDDPDVSKYKYNPLIKPPFNYTTLICMAMKAKGAHVDGKITLGHLLNWIAENFSYYKVTTDPTWQDSVYHALTTTKCFQKLTPSNAVNEQQVNCATAGNSIWRISPNHQLEVDSMFKKKRSLQPSTPQPHPHPHPQPHTLVANASKKPR